MDSTEIAALITVRNHLNLLVNSGKALPKDQVRAVQSKMTEMDKLIVTKAMELSLVDTVGVVASKMEEPKKVAPKTTMVDRAVMIETPDDAPMDLPPARPVKLGGGKKVRTPNPVETKTE